MKQFTSFLFLLTISFLLVCCYESKPAPKYPIDNAANSSQAQPAAPSINSSVSHYICSNNCANSGGDAAGNCPVCGNAYVHNSAYHNNAAAPPATTETSTTDVTFSDPNSTEPAQNASGVWHYTCGAGCEGGAGAAGTCTKCGGALAHNSTYHN